MSRPENSSVRVSSSAATLTWAAAALTQHSKAAATSIAALTRLPRHIEAPEPQHNSLQYHYNLYGLAGCCPCTGRFMHGRRGLNGMPTAFRGGAILRVQRDLPE